MRVVIFFCFFGVMLSSCASMGKQQSEVKRLTGIDLEGKRDKALLEGKEFVWGDWPEEKWWEVFQDEGLSSVIESALKDSPSLQSVEANVRAVKGQSDIVRSRLFPQINALFNVLWSYFGHDLQKLTPQLDPNFHLYTAGLDFGYEFDFWGKNRKLFEAALGEVLVQEALFQQAKVILSVTIALEYYNLQASSAKLQVMEELLATRSRQLELVLLRDKYRIDNAIDVNSVKQDVLFLQESLAALKEELELEKSSLLTLMGHNPTEELGFDLVWKANHKPFELPEKLGLDLLAKRADVAAGIASVKKSASLVGVAVAQFFPSIDLYGFVGYQSLELHKLFSGGTFLPGLLPFIQMPIFQGGKLRGYLKEKIAQHEATVYQYNDVVLKAVNEVVSGIERLMGVNERLKFQTEKSFFAKDVYELTDIKYKQGIDSLLGLLQTKEKYLWVEINQIELERMKYESVILLIKALGGGFSSG